MPKPTHLPAHPLSRYQVPVLNRTLDLLELLARHPNGLSLSAMTDALRIPKNTVFRIATTLTLRGYAEREETTKTYRASSQLLRLGHAAVGADRLIPTAAPILTALRDATGETALLGTLAGNHGVVLDQVPASHPVKVVVEIGHAFSLHTAAPAKAILAFWPAEKQRVFVRQLSFPKLTQNTLTRASAYLTELKRVQQWGYALDRCEESTTFACAAAPVFDRRGQPIAALWISGPSDRIPLASLDTLGSTVKQFADQLSANLGHRP